MRADDQKERLIGGANCVDVRSYMCAAEGVWECTLQISELAMLLSP